MHQRTFVKPRHHFEILLCPGSGATLRACQPGDVVAILTEQDVNAWVLACVLASREAKDTS
jgi:hypothetical protein